jgi:hypothetical protein
VSISGMRDEGRWTTKDGRWTRDDGRWTTGDGRGTTDGRLQSADGRRRAKGEKRKTIRLAWDEGLFAAHATMKRELVVYVRRDAFSNLTPSAAKCQGWSGTATLEHIQKPFFADRALGFSISKWNCRKSQVGTLTAVDSNRSSVCPLVMEIRFRMRSTYLTPDEATARLAEVLCSSLARSGLVLTAHRFSIL